MSLSNAVHVVGKLRPYFLKTVLLYSKKTGWVPSKGIPYTFPLKVTPLRVTGRKLLFHDGFPASFLPGSAKGCTTPAFTYSWRGPPPHEMTSAGGFELASPARNLAL